MNIIVPYTTHESLSDAQSDALLMEGIEPTFVCTGSFTTDYWYLFESLWLKGSTFILLEQDNIPFPGALKKMWDCPEPWCAHEYMLQRQYRWALGCAKFSTQLMNAYPDLMHEAYSGNLWANYGSRDWWELDVRVNQTLVKLYRLEPHIHQPPILHLNLKHLEA